MIAITVSWENAKDLSERKKAKKGINYLDELPSQDLKKPSFDTELPFTFLSCLNNRKTLPFSCTE